MITYNSFDIFDTCFIRSCGYPHNVFDLLATRLLGAESDYNLRADFVNIRLQGEERARKQKQGEVTLQEIYDSCDFSSVTNTPKTDIAKIELEIEKNVLVPVSSIRNQIAKLHSQGATIYYISDMYLPHEFILNLLQQNDFWKEGDKLYVSCTSGKTKQDGTLFDLVSQENKIPFPHWQHWGDNKHSDYKIPKKKGIKAHLVSHRFSAYEDNLLSLQLFHDSLINQRLAGIQKAIRLSEQPNNRTDLACNIVIPTLVSFVFKCLQDAQKEGISKLFFLARDGALPFYIASSLQEYFPTIQLCYFYTSRSALYFPGIPSTSFECLSELCGKMANKKLYEVFIDKTNIDITTFSTEEKIKQTIKTDKQGQILLKELYNNPLFKKHLEEEYFRQKDLVLKYFLQTGIANKNNKSGIVDIRGTRKCHQIINNLLAQNEYPKVKGYYLEVTENRKHINEAGSYYAEFHSERFFLSTKRLKYIASLYSVIEQYICATGSERTITYQENGNTIKPVFESNSASESKLKLFNLHKRIANLYIHHLKENSLFPYNTEISYLIQYNLLNFAELPYKKDLEALKNITTNDSQFDYSSLIKRYAIKELLNKKFNKNEWIRGSICYTIYCWVGERISRSLISKIQK